MNFRLIACNIFQREACACLARTPHVVDIDFIELGEHARPANLHEILQARIDAAENGSRRYDAVLLLFGLCGNAGNGLVARATPLVMPRAHDCATILLGSRAAFREHFGDNPSQGFSSSGYVERGDYYLRRPDEGSGVAICDDAYAELVRQYGEENAKYVWETMHPARPSEKRALFIRMPGVDDAAQAARFRERAEADGKEYTELTGSTRLIAALIEGHWDPAEFLIVPPGHQTTGVYDMDEIIRATPLAKK
jgi:hypothetical protein